MEGLIDKEVDKEDIRREKRCKRCSKVFTQEYREYLCSECREKSRIRSNKEYWKKYYKKNKERILEKNMKYMKDNPEWYSEYSKKWKEENEGYYREYGKRYREKMKIEYIDDRKETLKDK